MEHEMKRDEFLKGWSLLVMQPWGYRYNKVDTNGRPVGDGLMQLNLYFESLKWADAQAWLKVTVLFARGEKWPSVNELRDGLRNVNGGFVKALSNHPEYCEMPDEVRAMIEKIGKPVTRK
jgi:hypothetical protein